MKYVNGSTFVSVHDTANYDFGPEIQVPHIIPIWSIVRNPVS